ncbi:MAG: DUF2341 domain-containing protein, partial [Elusimicrobiota bacterium]
MRRLGLSALLAAFTLTHLPNAAAEVNTWWDTDWKQRVKIHFNNAAIAETLNDFPVLIRLTTGQIDYSLTEANGEDLRFVDADQSNVLAYEIEKWDLAGNSTSYIWVRVPAIDASSNLDHIWLYYDKDGAAAGGEPLRGLELELCGGLAHEPGPRLGHP